MSRASAAAQTHVGRHAAVVAQSSTPSWLRGTLRFTMGFFLVIFVPTLSMRALEGVEIRTQVCKQNSSNYGC